MLKFAFRIVFSLACLLSNAPSQTEGVFHRPPDNGRVGEDLRLEATLLSRAEVIQARLYYRVPGASAYQELEVQPWGIYWVGLIPGDQLTTSGLEYNLVFRLREGGVVTSPSQEPFDEPHRIPILPPEAAPPWAVEEVSADILILSPERGTVLEPDEVVVAASYFNAPQVDTASIRVAVDGIDFTSRTAIGAGIISLDPGPLEMGIHTIILTMADQAGQPVQPLEWSFTVSSTGPHLEDFLRYRGQVGSRASSERVGDLNLNITELTGEAETAVSWARVNTSFRITSRESPFQQSQNRFQGTVRLGDFLQVRLGDFNPSLSPFTIDGKRVRGLGLVLDLNWFRFHYLQGELNRAVQHNGRLDGGYILRGDETRVDSLNVRTYVLDRMGYAFRRNLTAARLAVGKESRFQAGLHLLKAIDKLASLDQYPPGVRFRVDTSLVGIDPGIYTYDQFAAAVAAAGHQLEFPALSWGGGDPQDNLVVGFDLRAAFDDQQLRFDMSWNLSFYNRNIWEGALSRAALDTALDPEPDGFIGGQEGSKIDTSLIPFDPMKYERIFTINQHMVPLVPIDVTSLKKHPIASLINMPSSAFNFRLRGHYSRNSFTVEYRQVGPEFVSLGNPYMNSNVREFIITNRVSLMDRKLSLSGGFKHRDNKILATTVNPLSTNTWTFSSTLVPGPAAPSAVFNFQSIGRSNFKTELDSVAGQLVDLREDSRAINTLLSLNLPLTTGNLKHTLVINYNKVDNTDLLASKRKRGYLFPKTDTKTISLNVSTRFTTPLRTALSYSNTKLLLPLAGPEGIEKVPYTWTGLGVSGQYSLLEEQLRLLTALSFVSSAGLVTSRIYGLKAGGEYALGANLTLSLSGTLQVTEIPSQQSDGEDNDGDGKKDEAGEAFDLNTAGFLVTFRYNFGT